jgi:hypothetical protein
MSRLSLLCPPLLSPLTALASRPLRARTLVVTFAHILPQHFDNTGRQRAPRIAQPRARQGAAGPGQELRCDRLLRRLASLVGDLPSWGQRTLEPYKNDAGVRRAELWHAWAVARLMTFQDRCRSLPYEDSYARRLALRSRLEKKYETLENAKKKLLPVEIADEIVHCPAPGLYLLSCADRSAAGCATGRDRHRCPRRASWGRMCFCSASVRLCWPQADYAADKASRYLGRLKVPGCGWMPQHRQYCGATQRVPRSVDQSMGSSKRALWCHPAGYSRTLYQESVAELPQSREITSELVSAWASLPVTGVTLFTSSYSMPPKPWPSIRQTRSTSY